MNTNLIEHCSSCGHKKPIINRRYHLCGECNRQRIENHKVFLGIDTPVERLVVEVGKHTPPKSTFLTTHKNAKSGETGNSFPELVKLLDILFSRWVKKVYTDDEGKVTCYTCGARYKVSEIENGHFIPRKHMATRWHEDNCRPQCKDCNDFKEGSHNIFRKYLIEEIGFQRTDDLERLAKTDKKFSIPELQIMISHYKYLIEKK